MGDCLKSRFYRKCRKENAKVAKCKDVYSMCLRTLRKILAPFAVTIFDF